MSNTKFMLINFNTRFIPHLNIYFEFLDIYLKKNNTIIFN
jgi:hypothetical protein